MTNYRPVSLLTSFSKVLEKVIYIRIVTLSNHSMTVNEQFGFGSKYSTGEASYNLMREITNDFNSKRIV